MIADGQRLPSDVGIVKANAAQRVRMTLLGIEHGQSNSMVPNHPTAELGLASFQSVDAHASFNPGHKKRCGLKESRYALEIEANTIGDVEGISLEHKLVEDADVVGLPIARLQRTQNICAQLEQYVEVDKRFNQSNWYAREQRQAHFGGRGVKRVPRIIQFNFARTARIELAIRADNPLGKFGVDATISYDIGFCRHVAANLRTQPHVPKLVGRGAKTRLDVAQTLSKSPLCETHDQQLFKQAMLLALKLPL